MSYIIRIAVVGPVSTGKSTLINSIFINQYSDMKIKRTTMLPQVYLETTNKDNIVDSKVIYSRNQTINENILSGKVELNNDNCQEITHLVPQITDIIKMPDNVYLEFYDLPGLDDGKQEKIYFDYLKTNFNKFDIILFNIDINEALNTSGSINILDELLDNIKKSYSKKYLYVIINKCDNMDYNETTGSLDLASEELEEMYEQIITIVNEKTKDIENIEVEFIKLGALDSYIYRMLNKDPHCKLDDKDRDKFGINEYGKKWKKMSEKKKIQYIQDCLNEDYEEKLIVSGFKNFINKFNITLNSTNQINILLSHLNEEIFNYFEKVKEYDFVYTSIFSNNKKYDQNKNQILRIIADVNNFYTRVYDIKNIFNKLYVQYYEKTLVTYIYPMLSEYFNKMIEDIEKIDCSSNNEIGENIINNINYIYLCIDSNLKNIYILEKRDNLKLLMVDSVKKACNILITKYLDFITCSKNIDRLYNVEQYLSNFELLTNYLLIIENNINNLKKVTTFITDLPVNYENIFELVLDNIINNTPKIITLTEYTPLMRLCDYFMKNLKVSKCIIKEYYKKWLKKKYLDYDLYFDKSNNFTPYYKNCKHIDFIQNYYSYYITTHLSFLQSNTNNIPYILCKILFYINMTYYKYYETVEIHNNYKNDLDIFIEIDKYKTLFNDTYIEQFRNNEILDKLSSLRYIDILENKKLLIKELEYYNYLENY
jgi:GTPase Era involved in 16S rRNA processing